MRPLITIAMIVLLIGGMGAYVEFKNGVVRPPSTVITTFAKQETKLILRRSATLYDGGNLGGPALTASIKGKRVLELKRKIEPEETIEIVLPDVEVGKNSVYVAANFEDPEAFLSDAAPLTLYALETVILYGGVEQKRAVHTSADPFVVGGDIAFEIKPAAALMSAEHSGASHTDAMDSNSGTAP